MVDFFRNLSRPWLRHCLMGMLLTTMPHPSALAANDDPYWVYLAADVAPPVVQQIETVFERSLPPERLRIRRAERPDQNQRTLTDLLRDSGRDVVLVLDRPGRFADWQPILEKYTPKPGSSVVMTGIFPKQNFPPGFQKFTLIGSPVSSFADQISQGFAERDVREVLCLYADLPDWCAELTSRFGGVVHVHQIDRNASDATKMALTVSMITRFPQIDGVFVSEPTNLDKVSEALTILEGDYVVGTVASAGKKRPDVSFVVQPQWSLLTALSHAVVSARRHDQQGLAGLIYVPPARH